jgi:hypothetical protein
MTTDILEHLITRISIKIGKNNMAGAQSTLILTNGTSNSDGRAA